MKKRIFYGALVAVILVVAFIVPILKGGEKKGKLIATAGKYKIYEDDMQERLTSLTNSTGEPVKLSQLAGEILNVVVLEAGVNEKIDDLAKQKGYNSRADVKKLVESYKKDIIREKFLDDAVYSKVTDTDVFDEYVKMENALKGQEERKIRHILVDTEEEIERIRRSIKRSADFANVAMKKSKDTGSAENGGDIGYVMKPELDPDFANVAFILKVDEVSKPVKSQFGWHLILVEDIRPAQYLRYEEVKENIRQNLQQRAIREYVKDLTADLSVTYIDQEIKDKTPILPMRGDVNVDENNAETQTTQSEETATEK